MRARRGRPGCSCAREPFQDLRANREPEARAAPGFAVHADLAAHHLGELLAHREPEAGAAEAPRGRPVGLAEGLEQASLRFGADADAAVGDDKAQQALGRHRPGNGLRDALDRQASLRRAP